MVRGLRREESRVRERWADAKTRQRIFAAAALLGIATVAFVDWKVVHNLSLGYLYVFPMLLLGLSARPAWIVGVALVCAVLREQFTPTPWEPEAPTSLFVAFVAFAGGGLLMSEQSRSRRRAERDAAAFADQVRRRERAEEDLHLLVESSPAAILIIGEDGAIARANEAAVRLLRGEEGLPGRPVKQYLPALASVLDGAEPSYRTALECVGRRHDGETFLAHIWFSTYRSRSGGRLAAIVHDSSDDLWDREAAALDRLLDASRIMVTAVSHEVRNLSAAASFAHKSLSRRGLLAGDPDFAALQTCLEGLQQIAASELRVSSSVAVGRVDLANLLEELRILLEPRFREASALLEWNVEPGLVPVRGDHHSLLQIFLNLAQNSLAAMVDADPKVLSIRAGRAGEEVVVQFRDTGPGIADGDELFRPFQSATGGAGLGLFVSRTLARHFAGDLRVEPSPQGSCFVVSLSRAA
jgi:signal transduction histidine kinase